MHITFGLGLDSCRGPSSESSFNAPTLGPMGFLGLLETYLGLSRPDVSVARRVTGYLGHLRQHDDGSRFYSQSLHADSIGTAAKLLTWRDEWRLGGWNGSASESAPRRIREMALVEQSAYGDIAPGQAERLAVIETKLVTERTPIESVRLVDPIDIWPAAWRKVLARFSDVSEWRAQSNGTGQLRALQDLAERALREGHLPGTLPSVTDGSMTLLQATSRATAEHWLSAWCTHNEADRLIVCESSGDAVDTTLVATGSVSCGFESPSELRPALQAVGLALEMCWSPIDTGRLVEFLLHPIGPFGRSARSRLAKAMGEQPGIGGEAWSAARREIAETEKGEKTLEEIAFWLEGERWSRDTGAPVDTLLVRVDRLREALRHRLTGDASLATIYVPAIEQCSAVLDGLSEFKRQGVDSLLPRQVEQLILHATPASATNPAAIAQIGCMRSAPSAGACIEPADEVVWWMPSTPALPQPLPWTNAEIQALRQLRVELRDPQRELSYLALQWLRPLLAARKHFVLVLPPPGGEEHPFRQLIFKLVPDIEANCLNLDSEVNGTYIGILADPLARLPFPETPRIIELKEPIALPAESQSYTSLTELFNHPALYALKRVARLRPNSVISAEEGNRLLGTLAHRVFETLFAHPDALGWSNQQAVHWFKANVDNLLQTEGAPLLMQGAGVSQQRFKAICESAIISLLDHLRSAGATSVRTEVEFDGVLGNVPLTGKVDLVVELPGARTVALDMKWRGDKRYAATLTEGKHLQLALYSALIEQKSAVPPSALGYFIVETGSLYVTAEDLFPTAQVRAPRNGITVNELLTQARESWKWRASQWEAGQIEVVSEEALDDVQGPEGTLPVEGLGPWHFDHLVLLGGWEQ